MKIRMPTALVTGRDNQRHALLTDSFDSFCYHTLSVVRTDVRAKAHTYNHWLPELFGIFLQEHKVIESILIRDYLVDGHAFFGYIGSIDGAHHDVSIWSHAAPSLGAARPGSNRSGMAAMVTHGQVRRQRCYLLWRVKDRAGQFHAVSNHFPAAFVKRRIERLDAGTSLAVLESRMVEIKAAVDDGQSDSLSAVGLVAHLSAGAVDVRHTNFTARHIGQQLGSRAARADTQYAWHIFHLLQ